jgi:hypothetical protein
MRTENSLFSILEIEDESSALFTCFLAIGIELWCSSNQGYGRHAVRDRPGHIVFARPAALSRVSEQLSLVGVVDFLTIEQHFVLVGALRGQFVAWRFEEELPSVSCRFQIDGGLAYCPYAPPLRTLVLRKRVTKAT